MADPILPNLGIELLCERLRADGIACDVFYGTLRLAPVVAPDVIHGIVGQILYSPLYFDIDIDRFVDEITAVIAETTQSQAMIGVADELHKSITAAELNLEKCLSDILVGTYDVVGFSIIFDTQKLPSAALAKLLKLREPGMKVLFGGTGCDGDMAGALLEMFPEIDAVMTGDADETITAGVMHLFAGVNSTVALPPNLHIRTIPGREVAQVYVSASELEARVSPRFDSYIAQRTASIYARTHDLTLLFEGSRGCWWGDKHHCTFCGIRTVDEGFRQRSIETVLDEIVALYDAHQPYLLYATDAILSREHLHHLLPKLVELRRKSGRNIKLFFEVKSNLSRADIALLADAGVVAVQPGIESFADSVLSRTDKGATGVRQLAALKWLATYGIDTIYGLLVGTPGETASDLRTQIELSRRIHHLQPPVGVNTLGLHRFSPYFRNPAAYGIENVRPFKLLEVAYRGAPRDLLMRLCYELDYDTREKCDPVIRELVSELRLAVAEWRLAYAKGERLIISEALDSAVISHRQGNALTVSTLRGEELAVYRAIVTPTTAGRVADVTGLSPNTVACYLTAFERSKWAATLSGAWLALAIPVGVDAHTDSVQVHSAATARAVVPITAVT